MSTRSISQENRLQTLKALAQMGWMTTRMLAQWVYCDAKSIHSGVNQAQRTTARLAAAGLIKSRPGVAGRCWVLTKSGAAALNAQTIAAGYPRGWAHHGYDISTNNFLSQTLLSKELAIRRRNGFAVIGRAALRAGLIANDLTGLDGAYAVPNDGDYTVVGVLVVTSAADNAVEHIRRLAKRLKIQLHLLGDERLVSTVRKKLGQ